MYRGNCRWLWCKHVILATWILLVQVSVIAGELMAFVSPQLLPPFELCPNPVVCPQRMSIRNTCIRRLCRRRLFVDKKLNESVLQPEDSFMICEDQIRIEKIELDNKNQLERMAEFCIDAFYNQSEEQEGTFSRMWKGVKLSALTKAQMLDFSLPSGGNRSVFVAKIASNSGNGEIIGCCEVIEEQLDISPQNGEKIVVSERDRRRTARLRPIIENLCVKREYRGRRIGLALLNACEKSARSWMLSHGEVFAQVEEGNKNALDFFKKCGYQVLFADPTCFRVQMDKTFFLSQVPATKFVMRKVDVSYNET